MESISEFIELLESKRKQASVENHKLRDSDNQSDIEYSWYHLGRELAYSDVIDILKSEIAERVTNPADSHG